MLTLSTQLTPGHKSREATTGRFALTFFSTLFVLMFSSSELQAAKVRRESSSESSGYSSYRSGIAELMNVDITMHYVRDTTPLGPTDSALKLNFGGMFNEYIGLDAIGLYQFREQNYLGGGAARLQPIPWLFVKGGIGIYADKRTREIKGTPLGSVGLVAHLAPTTYILTEGMYFATNNQRNMSFGAGLGFKF